MLGQESVVPAVVLGWPLAEWMEMQDRDLGMMGVRADEPFFRNVLQPAREPWAPDGEAVNRVLKRAVAAASEILGLQRPATSLYSSHSLRRGGAQFLRDCGVSRELIKVMGCWRSDAVDAYLDTVAAMAKRRMAKVFSLLKGQCSA